MATGPAPQPTPTSPRPALVGRDPELAALRAALDAALAGRGALVLIGGEAGIGKTALVEALLAEATERGALVLVGRCYDLSETPPYGPWAEAFDRDAHGETVPTPPDLAGDGATSQAALFGQVREYLAALAATQPVVLLLDDVHWADPASLDLLRAIARDRTASALLLVATYRAEAVARDQPLHALLPLLVREARAARLDLRPFDDAAIAALVAARYALTAPDQARLVAYLAGRTEGNALFLGEVLRTLEGEGTLRRADAGWQLGDLERVPVPPLLRQVIEGRVARLDRATEGLLAVAAVIGQAVPLHLWAAVGGRREEDLLDHAARAVDARLLVETPDGMGVRFAHALIREALYEATPVLRRRVLHRQAAEALIATPRPDPDAVAAHLQRAGDPRAAAWLERAGERAQRAYAWLTAAERYEAVLALLEAQGEAAGRRGWLAFRLGALRRYADPPRALADTEAALRLAREAGDPLLAGMADFLAGMLLDGYLGQLGRGTPRMEAGLRAIAALPAAARVPPGADTPLDPAPRWGTVLVSLANRGHQAEALALAERYFAEVAPPATADWLGGNPYADALLVVGQARRTAGQPAPARAALAQARALYRAVGHHYQERLALLIELLVVLHYQADRPAEVGALLAEAAEVQARAEGAGGFPLPRGQHPAYLLLAGRWDEARRTAEAIGAAGGQAPLAQVEPPTLGWLYRAQGEAARAAALVAAALPGGPGALPGHATHATALEVQRLAAALALDTGDLPAARAWLEAHDRARGEMVLGQAEGHLGWAGYHRAAGDLPAARRQAEAALAHATAPRQPLALLAAHRLLGELDTAAGAHAGARAHLAAARALAEACAAPYERALTLLALAELRAAEGHHDEAGTALEEARALLTPLEAHPALARADALAARLATPAPALAALPFGLTAREADVLRLLAVGLTDPQIAERLFVSRNTVSTHLRAIYGKLGVNTRAAAARLAAERGLA